MKFTNDHNLPEPMVNALRGDARDFRINWPNISLTVLNMPPRQAVLMHWNSEDIVEDVSDRTWLLLGSAMHMALEGRKDHRHLIEVPCMLELSRDVKVWMRVDVVEKNTISDYKITSVWSSVFRDKNDVKENMAQLNPYRIGIERQWGLDITKLRIVHLYRDWARSKKDDKGYPDIPFGLYDVPIAPDKEVLQGMEDRARILNQSILAEDKDLPKCSDIERWTKPTVYAVMKEGRKSAVKLHKSMASAETYKLDVEATVGGKYRIDVRPGVNVRCEDYCAAKPFCSQYKTLKEGE